MFDEPTEVEVAARSELRKRRLSKSYSLAAMTPSMSFAGGASFARVPSMKPSASMKSLALAPSALEEDLPHADALQRTNEEKRAELLAANAAGDVLDGVAFDSMDVGKWIVHPDATWWIWWNYLTVASAMITGFVEPFKIAFTDSAGEFPGTSFWSVQDYISTVIFITDLILRFFVADYNAVTGMVETDLKQISKNYFHGMFWMDFLFAFPIDWIALLIVKATPAGQENPKIEIMVSCIKFIKMGRMYRVLQFFSVLDKKMVISAVMLLLIRNWIYVLYSSHWAACIFYLIARLQDFSETTWVGRAATRRESLEGEGTIGRYIYSLYLAVAAFVGSVGDNDFYEANVAEACFMIIYCLFNIVLASYILGTVTMLMVKFDERSKALRDKKTNLIKFKDMHKIPDRLYHAMTEHLELHFNSEQTSDDNVLNIYPAALRRKVLRELYYEQVKGCYLFRDTGDKFIDALIASSRVELFMPSVELLQRGDISQELLIVMDGDVLVASDDKAAAAPKLGLQKMGSLKRIQSLKQAVVTGIEDYFKKVDNSSVKLPQPEPSRNLGIFSDMWKKKVHTFDSRRNSDDGSIDSQATTIKRLGSNQSAKSFKRYGSALRGHGNIERKSTSAALGELSFFTEMPSQNTVVTASVSRILHISHAAFDGLGKMFPTDMRCVMQEILNTAENTLANDLMDLTGLERAAIINECLGNPNVQLVLPEEEMERLQSTMSREQIMHSESLRHMNHSVKMYFEKVDRERTTKLLNNVANNAVSEVKQMLSQGMSPNAHDYDGRTALHIAASEDQEHMCEILLDAGANATVQDRFKRTPMLEAVQAGNTQIVELLSKHKASLRGDSLVAAIELTGAAAGNDLEYLQRLLKAGVDVDVTFTDSRTALHIAASGGQLAMVEALVDAGATLGLRDHFSRTALDCAMAGGHEAVVAYLEPHVLAEQRSGVVCNEQLETWMVSAALSRTDIIDRLLSEGMDIDITSRPHGGRTALMLAAEAGHQALVCKLLDKGADPLKTDVSGLTAMFYAARAGRSGLVKMLRERGTALGVDPQLCAYHVCAAAKTNDGLQFLRCLLMAGVDANVGMLDTNTTPLHVAAVTNAVPCIRMLLADGHADPHVKSRAGLTALDLAERAGSRAAADRLREAMGLASGSPALSAAQTDLPTNIAAALGAPTRMLTDETMDGGGPIKANRFDAPRKGRAQRQQLVDTVSQEPPTVTAFQDDGEDDLAAATRLARRRRASWFMAYGQGQGAGAKPLPPQAPPKTIQLSAAAARRRSSQLARASIDLEAGASKDALVQAHECKMGRRSSILSSLIYPPPESTDEASPAPSGEPQQPRQLSGAERRKKRRSSSILLAGNQDRLPEFVPDDPAPPQASSRTPVPSAYQLDVANSLVGGMHLPLQAQQPASSVRTSRPNSAGSRPGSGIGRRGTPASPIPPTRPGSSLERVNEEE